MARKKIAESTTDQKQKVPPKKRPPGWRAEKSELTRQRLFEAAIRLVGEAGHPGATIRRITTRARIAHGTFYNYFATQQDIFDQILPYLGSKLLAYLEERLDPCQGFVNRPDEFLVAFDDFVRETPAFYRVVAEAEAFAPKAYRLYIANTLEWLTRRFSSDPHLAESGSIDHQHLEMVALMVMAAANYVNMRFGNWMGEDTRIPAWAVEAFQKFIRGGIMSVGGQQIAESLETAPLADTDERSDESMAVSGGVVKFTPRASSIDARLSYSAQSIQIDCRLVSLSPGHVVLELDIDRRTLNSRGAVAGGTLSALVEVAAATAMADRAEQISAETISLNCVMIRPAMEGVLVADTRMENAGRHIRFVTVRITLDTLDGLLIANATATMRVIE